MHPKYQKINLLSGWMVFVISALVYMLTLEPSASFWDCGEFIAASHKLMVGHPPGAPFFLLVGRLFSLFAGGNTAHVAVAINMLSALSSAFTIAFLFWTLIHLLRKTMPEGRVQTTPELVLVMLSAAIGALSYAFTDTFWFSAVEAEVYASSSLFTAIVFWAILKWEQIADEPYADRWLVLIAYLMGLSIGVHLLNLLAIPAIVLIYYFKRYQTTPKGVLAAVSFAAMLLGGTMYLFIPGFIRAAAFFEKLLVNGFGFPYHNGVLVFMALFTALVVYGIRYATRENKKTLHLLISCLAVLAIGYSSYALIIIRSNAQPPMNQNNPNNVFRLLSYLNRDQYGASPLIAGPYFNAPRLASVDNGALFDAADGRYIEVSRKQKVVYDKAYTTLFPRMWSEQPAHISAYLQWTGHEAKDFFKAQTDAQGKPSRNQQGEIIYDFQNPRTAPRFTDNLRFFFRYQLGHMYFRYFLWNFSGRQNDMQSHFREEFTKGNWQTGFTRIDQQLTGSQQLLPRSQKENKARNHYFLIPMLLGIFGMLYHARAQPKDFWVVATLFVFTGIAIVVYLNQQPLQPRERDYAYAASFYAFSIWIGFALKAFFDLASQGNWQFLLPRKRSRWLIVIVGVVVVAYLTGNAATGLLIIYIVLLLLLLFGFAIGISYLTKNKNLFILIGAATTLLSPLILLVQNYDDHDRSNRYFARDFANNYLQSCKQNAILFTNGDNDTFPLWYLQEVEGQRTDVRVCNLSYLSADWYIDQMKLRSYQSAHLPISLPSEKYRMGKREVTHLVDLVQHPIKLNEAIKFVAQDDPKYKQIPNVNRLIDFIPQHAFVMDVDSQAIRHGGLYDLDRATKVQNQIVWQIGTDYLLKNQLMVLDIISTNQWERPVYYAITVSDDNYLNLESLFELQGMAYQVVPYRLKPNARSYGSINPMRMYTNMMEHFKWGASDLTQVYLDENIRRMLSNLRNNFGMLAGVLIQEGHVNEAIMLMDKCIEIIPDKALPFDIYLLETADHYFKAGEQVKGTQLFETIRHNCTEELNYLLTLGPAHRKLLQFEQQMHLHVLNELSEIATRNGNNRLGIELNQEFQRYGLNLQGKM